MLRAKGALRLDGWNLWSSVSELNGETLNLTPAEANILHTLGQAGGNVVTIEDIGLQFSEADNANSVRVMIAKIRKKLGHVCPIQTVRGFGYRWRHAVLSNRRGGY